ncbi:cysteine-rich CWC family protein [Chitinophaga sedimenti]|uniref:cysteine-rich CWC family protein n=1 Tax=Chitinophaga sedimenti TaxID=2033606 RepID=UPI0020053A04|nr:cysteine-rich CWC family protein [Chitinophaga sedimenti]MCK7556422.1 cysteine-rich CWC family protein [Chitinophaga sedimenti]
MACHETKYCQRCQAPFECKVGNILQCQCNGIELTADMREHIANAYTECLCRQCLLEIQGDFRNKPRREKLSRLLSFIKSR